MNLPRYVKMGTKSDPTCLRLKDNQYWVDGGAWGIGWIRAHQIALHENGQSTDLYSSSPMDGLNKQPLFSCTEEEWFERNKSYVPYGYEFEDGSIHNATKSHYDTMDERYGKGTWNDWSTTPDVYQNPTSKKILKDNIESDCKKINEY